ncbi:hypothetical protein [Chryseobacterium indologenes]|uniref:Signal peptide-containing protein n=1 Tax=Chryseobacterium indologenes TaxID=253 RepID=A0A0N0IX14_CHRID|nr:hypothetical protein [Chryseobacterium indologenes]KPE51871.1 hypothetical protein AOB46_06495 [Chryseobacterium indologenes]
MKQLINFILIILISTLSAGVYGILHDQITYTISPEYYTLLKFQQFGFEDLNLKVRIKVGIIGFLAAWWVGLFLGIAYAFISLFLDPEKVLKVTVTSILINICITLISGILGYGFAVLFLSQENINWYIPAGTRDIRSFINVGSVHNFGYIGGVTGLAAGLLYQIKKAKNS